MERDSFLYRARRKGQVLAHFFLPDELLARFYSRIVLGKSVNLSEPETFNEKIQWLKLYVYPKDPLVIQGSDKFAVRSYVQQKGLERLLVPMIGVWQSVDEIDWDSLPEQFVLKCNHGCAYNILCEDKNKLERKAVERKLQTWMKEDFGVFNIELHYSNINPHRIICEEFLGNSITDYKFFCFNGEPKFLYVSNNLIHDRQAQIGFFYLDGRKMPMKRNDYIDITSISLPDFYYDMKKSAETLCNDFAFVRVDFLLTDTRYYFAELTFTPSAGMMPFNPDKCDLEWGRMLDISNVKQQEQA